MASRHLVDHASVTLGSTPTICRNACQSCLNFPRFASLEYLLSCVSNASRSQFNQNILMISRVRAQVPCGRRSQAWRYAKSDGDAFCPKCPYGSSFEPHSIAYRMLFGILTSKPSTHSMRYKWILIASCGSPFHACIGAKKKCSGPEFTNWQLH